METQQTLTRAGIPFSRRERISRLSKSVKRPFVTSVGNILALSRVLFALFMVVLASLGGIRWLEIVGVILLSYLFYSAAMWVGLLAKLQVAKSVDRYSAWVDLGLFTSMVSLTEGTSPILFGGIWLAILSSYHKHGRYVGLMTTGLGTTIAAIDLFFRFGSKSFSVGIHPLQAEVVTLICASLGLGIIAYYLERQKRTLEDRVGLLLGVSDFSNPRFGAEWSLNTLMEKVRAFYEADACLFIDLIEGESSHRIYRKTSSGTASVVQTESIGDECAQQLLVVPKTHAFVLSPSGVPVLGKRYIEYDVLNKSPTTHIVNGVESLAVLLEAESIVSVPIFRGSTVTGRIFLTSTRKKFFSADAPAFLSRFFGQHLALIENLRLLDSLETTVSERERKHIALDMHDNVVQPYIGIQLGLGAIRRKVEAGITDITEDLDKVAAMAELEVSGLRHYMRTLGPGVKHDGQFLPAVQRLTEKFAATTGIAVEVKTSQEIALNDKLAAEAFQMIAEGLSNIRRHSSASEATVEIDCTKKDFQLRISNNGRNDTTTSEFVPKSIASRATSFGGRVNIDLNSHDQTVLDIRIPFQL